MNERNLEQWLNIKFCVKIRKSANEMLALLKMFYGEHDLKKLDVVLRSAGDSKESEM